MAGAEHRCRRLEDAGVGKLAVLAQDVQVPDACQPKDSPGLLEPADAAAEPCIPDAGPSAARSCEALAAAAALRPPEDAGQPELELELAQRLRRLAAWPAKASSPQGALKPLAHWVERQFAAALQQLELVERVAQPAFERQGLTR